MTAEEKLAKRVILHERLTAIDYELEFVFGEPASHRISEVARDLLNRRAEVHDQMLAVGYQPWCVPIDHREAKVS